MTTKAVPRHPSEGIVLGTPGVFGPISDPRWFLDGGGGGLGGDSCCQAGSCPTPSPSAGPSLEPPLEGPTGEDASSGATPGGGAGTTAPSAPPSPSPSPGPMYQAEAYGLSQVQFFAGRAASGSLIDPARGNLIQQHAIPAGGPLDPVVVLSYSDAYRGVSDEYPDGWTSNFKRRIDSSASPDVDVISGSGTAYRYVATASAYTAPEEAVNWLQDDTPSGWIETQPDGLKYYYDSAGKLTKLVNHLGKVWTVTYVSGTSRVSNILNPASKRTTFHYDAGNKLQAIQDAGGRRTTLTVSSNRLTKLTTPELCETQFSYDGSGRLQTRISPSSSRTTYSYDASSRVTNVTFPDGNKTTYSYSGDNVIFTDQRGNVTTLMHSVDKLLETIIDPLRQRILVHYLTIVVDLRTTCALSYSGNSLQVGGLPP